MATERSQFFDSVEDDRVYTADDFARFFRYLYTNGIKGGGYNLHVTAGTGLQARIDYGTAMINGYAYFLEEDGGGTKTVSLQAADGQPRVDRIVLRLDTSNPERRVYLAAIKGTPGPSPSPPTLTRDSNVYELSLARISVPASAASISSGNITDERYDPAVCGIMNGLTALDASEFFDQASAILDQLENQGYLPLGAQAADSAKLEGRDASSFANSTHSHAQSEVSGLATALAGKAAASHNHNASAINDGTLDIGRIPTGTTSTTVALGNHNHSGVYAPASHSHSGSQVIVSYGTANPGTLAAGQIYVKI